MTESFTTPQTNASRDSPLRRAYNGNIRWCGRERVFMFTTPYDTLLSCRLLPFGLLVYLYPRGDRRQRPTASKEEKKVSCGAGHVAAVVQTASAVRLHLLVVKHTVETLVLRNFVRAIG